MVMNNDTRDKNGKLNNKDTRLLDEDETTASNSKKNLSKPKGGKSGGSSEFDEEKIRVGQSYQASIPPMISSDKDTQKNNDKATLVWSPNDDGTNAIDEYINLAKERYHYTCEQALGLLFWHKHDLSKAVMDLPNFTPLKDSWSKEDRVLFEQAFQFHGKQFQRIRQMLPDKTIADLVKYYYVWKKTKNKLSVIDRQEKRRNEGKVENGSEHGSIDESDIEEKKWSIRGIRRTSRSPIQSAILPADNNPSSSSSTKSKNQQRFGNNKTGNENKDTGYSSSSSSSNGVSKLSSLNCHNCTVLCNELKPSTVGNLCSSCHNHWRRTGLMRPTQGPYNMGIEVNQRPRSKTNKLYYLQGYHDGSSKYKRKPPKGMYINHDDIRKLAAQDIQASGNATEKSQANDLMTEVEHDIDILLGQIQTNKQQISLLKSRNELKQESRSSEENTLNRNKKTWTKDEEKLARMACMKYGRNLKAIAEMLGTKTESQVGRKFKEANFKDLEAIKPNINVMKNSDIMEIDSDDDGLNGEIIEGRYKRKSEDDTEITGKKKIEKLDEITITPIRKTSNDNLDSSAT